jgi:hypothetical protein
MYYSRMGQTLIEGSRWHLMRSRKEKSDWRKRSAVVLQSADNSLIPRNSGAGSIIGGCLLMHNSLRVRPDSYYNYAALRMIQRNRGVHEPQEERAFQEILPHIPPRGTMIELGAYWAFYSSWFCREVRLARCVLVEPVLRHLVAGRENFYLNGLSGTFVHAAVGTAPARSTSSGPPMVSLDSLVEDHSLDRVNLLHSDIQGHEVAMLRGGTRTFAAGLVDVVFISTHGDAIHSECGSLLRMYGMKIIAEHTRRESYSGDGLIVAKHPRFPGPDWISLSRRDANGESTPVQQTLPPEPGAKER